MKTLILAHGILGYGSSKLLSQFSLFNKFHYFSEIKNSINEKTLRVLEPAVGAIDSIAARSSALAEFINSNTNPEDEIYIIAHSMGGLDSVAALPTLNDNNRRVIALATVGTPFKGSPVADAIYDKINHPLLDKIPGWLTSALKNLGNQGLKDLKTTISQERFDAYQIPADLKIYCIAGTASNDNKSPLFKLAAAISNINNAINDGVVTLESAQPLEWKTQKNIELIEPTWPTDHFAEVGWPPSLFSIDQEHVDRYHILIERLTGIASADFKKP